MLTMQNWNQIICPENANEAFESFHGHFKYLFYVSFGFRKLVINNNKPGNEWITPEIRQLSIAKKELWYLIHVNDLDGDVKARLRDDYRMLCNHVKTQVKEAKLTQCSHNIQTSDNKAKAMWNMVNKLIKPPSTKNSIEAIKDKRGVTRAEKTQIPGIFNDFFINIA